MVKKQPSYLEHFILLILSAGILLVLFARLYANLKPSLESAQQNIASGKTLLLVPGVQSDSIKKILTSGDYFSDKKDIDFVADSLSAKINSNGPLDNLGSINKRSFYVNTPVAWDPDFGGKEFASRLLISRNRLGFDSAQTYQQELGASKPAYPAQVQAFNGNLSISGKVMDNGQPMPDVLVQLRQHIAMLNEDSADQEIPLYARTDIDGHFSFNGLIEDSGYSVVPLKPGYEFGVRQGTDRLSKSVKYNFKAIPLKVRIIGPINFIRLKEGNAFIVRSPSDFRSHFWKIAIVFLLVFFAVQFVFVFLRFYPDPFLLPIIMLLTGVSILVLFCIQHPLTDTLFAGQALQGVIIGLVAFTILSQLHVGKIYTRWWFDPIANLKKKNAYHLKGWTWLALALLLALVTKFAGNGPEGSGVTVNLQVAGINFQPSEITKYLLLVFFAAFFAANEERIRNLSDVRWRFAINWAVMLGTGILLGLYLWMGDMGPAIVVCLTFLVFYSIARGNLAITLLTGAVYGILLSLLPGIIATAVAFGLSVIIMVVSGQVKSAKWYGWFGIVAEAPIIMLLIIAAFTFGDRLPGVGDRLMGRKAMWMNQWDNNVYGGDHLAHSYWTLSSGGFAGQGLGKGYPNTLPAAHTDMILSSIGEELGLLGLIAVLFLFIILIHRIFLHARRAGQPFSFYISAGVAVATGIQFLLIACGAIGLLPLTGVAVPFLSYGKISLIINIAAIGIVAGISARPGIAIQKEYIRKYYDPVLIAGITGFMLGIFIIIGKLCMIQIVKGDEYIVKQSRTINRNGLPVFTRNPRIDKLTELLSAGNIYDRNGLLLATSNKKEITASMDSLLQAGLEASKLNEMIKGEQRRYYPFEEQMFFWVGDNNRKIFQGQANCFNAEDTYLSTLRGFDNNPQKINYITTQYRPNKFTKPIFKSTDLVKYDYSPLTAILRSGIDTNNQEVLKLKNKNKNIQLTIDAALQVELQKKLAQLSEPELKGKRISVVVLDAKTGDLLSSAVCPLPNLQQPENFSLSQNEINNLKKIGKPVAERDLGMTYATAPGSTAKTLTASAALNKLGLPASKVVYNDITLEETIDKGKEPHDEPVDMEKAIIESSNIFFIRLANDNLLDNEMADLYMETGMYVHFEGGYKYVNTISDADKKSVLKDWKEDIFDNRDREIYYNKKWVHNIRRYRSTFSGLPWGQGWLTSTPVAMARMSSAISNQGILEPSRYVLKIGDSTVALGNEIHALKDSATADVLTGFMKKQAHKTSKQILYNGVEVAVAGKTGTPEHDEQQGKGKRSIVKNDAWYVFFAPTKDKKSYTVVCVRIEDLKSGETSKWAIALSNNIIGILVNRGYISSY